MRRFVRIVAAVTAIAWSPAFGASFQCSGTQEQAEIAICDDPQLSLLDDKYALQYRAVTDTLKKAGEEERFLEVRQHARDFLKRRNQCNNSATCITATYEDELRYLATVSESYSTANNSVDSSNESNRSEGSASGSAPASQDLSSTHPSVKPDVAPDAATPPSDGAATNATPPLPSPDANSETTPPVPSPPTNPDNSSDQIGGIILIVSIVVGIVLFIYIYFLPSIIAFRRNHPNRFVILILNVVAGLTLLGWLLVLIWAMRAVHVSTKTGSGDGTDGGESGLNIFGNDEKRIRIVPNTDKASQIQKLKELLDSGAISQDEFDRLKKEILNR